MPSKIYAPSVETGVLLGHKKMFNCPRIRRWVGGSRKKHTPFFQIFKIRVALIRTINFFSQSGVRNFDSFLVGEV